MSTKRKRASGNPAKRSWRPMERGTLNPMLVLVHQQTGSPEPDEAWWNDLYQCVVYHYPSGMTHLSLKRHDRAAVRDWRHFQQIKNEIVGPERTAVEIFPPESELVDAANEYHLWVFPEAVELPFGFHERELMTPEQIVEFNARHSATLNPHSGGKARQRPWQPGLTTGLGEGEPDDDRR